MLGVAATGYLTALSLILAIGAQNAFMLRQGLLQAHVFWLCLLFALSDAVLIGAGVAGFGALVALLPWFPTAMALSGAAFLAAYGALRLRAAWRGGDAMALAGISAPLWPTLATGAAFTWLNPHVYLDTLGLIGAVSIQYAARDEKFVFALSATAASFTFFFALGYGARLLAPVMTSRRAWQFLDLAIALVMWTLAAALLHSL